MDSEEYLKKYLPDYDVAGMREKLQVNSKEELIEMLIIAYKNGQVAAKTADLLRHKLKRIEDIVAEPNIIPSVDRPPSNF